MKIELNKELNKRSIEEFARVMLEDVAEDNIKYNILEKENKISVKVFSQNLNKETEFQYEKLGEKIEDQELTMSKIALLKLYDKKYPWGSLMGVRPTKVLRRLLINGCTYGETRNILKNFYLVSDEKIDLMEVVVKKELELLDKEHINMYIGIPFCPTKCKYCSFASYEINGGVGKFYADFVETLLKEIEIIGKFLKTYNKKISSLYFGGGTPSTLTEIDLERVLQKLRKDIDLSEVKEFTFEAGREDSLNIKKLEIMKKYGVDRISLNPQSFNVETLKRVNRRFDRDNFDLIYKKAKDLEFIINMDFIIGLPKETTEEILYTIEEIKKYDIDNLTIHSLSFKRASNLFKESQEREEIDRALIEKHINNIVHEKKLYPYYMYRQKNIIEWGENIGYSKLGKESIFNIEMIEENQNTMALGGGGISKIVVEERKGIDYIERYVNPKDPALYIKELEKRCEEKIALFNKYK
ncbi:MULTISPECIES: coproporphyrinogen III oxidase [Fusobacterium]|uniref:coproporphyrinogen III oxidase n=1 Tax=Fusobacterium TaxID=848 RepID=UPI0025C2F001|nr:coproporphyrinogen III oxidase [Fusobacterium sp.]MCI7224026.1 coproporphyrinogen III oxidase [Fusobacterium sp.]MDD7410256.1 coproporphyrinogen III oxidase [Fusobacteriaceae bacterium]MDY5712556.1 coproporphyrinogen III oxidase [Fusobacterium gastrosuis]